MSLSLNSTLNLTRLAQHLNTRNFSRAANSMNRLARNQSYVSAVASDRAFSNYMRRLHNTLTQTRGRRRFNAVWTHPNLVFFGSRSPHARSIRNFIAANAQRVANAQRERAAGPNVNMGNAEAADRSAARARAQRQANANRAAGRRIAEQAARNAARARNAAAAETNRLRRAAAEAHVRAQANAVEASRRHAAAERAARNARNAAARHAAERAARNAAERAARNEAAAQAARNAAAAAAAAERAHRARTNAAAANAARRAKAHANAAAAAAAGGAGGSAGTNAAKAAKKAARNAETAAKAAARLAETRRNEEEKARKKAAHNVAVASWQQRFNAYKSAPHFLTRRQIISKMARNHIQVIIPETGNINRKLLLHIAPNKEFGSNNRKALKTVLMKEIKS